MSAHRMSNRSFFERLGFNKFAGRRRATNPARAAVSSVVETLEQRALFSVFPDPGSDFATAFNVGDLNGQQTFSDAVGPSDTLDFYKFTMPRAGQFFGRLRASSAPAEIDLIQEQIDPDGTVHEVFIDSRQANQDGPDGGFASGDLSPQFLTAGNYFLIVAQRGADTPYLIRMTADYGGNSLSDARDVGSVTDNNFQDFIGEFPTPSLNDPFDTYKFKMDAPGGFAALLTLDSTQTDTFQAHFSLIHDSNGNNAIDPGDLLVSTAPGTASKVISHLEAGTYFLRVTSDLNFSNYHLNMRADYAGIDPGTERVTGPLDAGKTFNDFISTSDDPIDQYQFSVNSTRPLNLVSFEAGTGQSVLSLFKDSNHDGIPDPSELVAATSAASFNNILTTIGPGNYIAQVRASSGEGTYQLFAETRPDRAGNSLGTACNLGTVNGLNHQDDYVSVADTVDFYKFTASAAGTVSAQLFSEVGGNTDLALIRDANNNGRVDANEILAASSLPGNQVDELSKSIAAGNYFLRVAYKDPAGTAKYFLTFHTDYAGSTPATARNVGTLAGTQSFDDWASGDFGGVISDTADVYKFSLASAKTLSAKMTGTLAGQDLNLELYQDKNHDGVLTANERVASSTRLNSPNEQITKALAAGTYFLRVVGLNGETNYHLTLKA